MGSSSLFFSLSLFIIGDSVIWLEAVFACRIRNHGIFIICLPIDLSAILHSDSSFHGVLPSLSPQALHHLEIAYYLYDWFVGYKGN